MKWDVFICHSKEDVKTAILLKDQLSDLGLRVWIDEEGIERGEILSEVIEMAIEYSYVGVVLITPTVISKKHDWVFKEILFMENREKSNKLKIWPVFYNCEVNTNMLESINSESDMYNSTINRLSERYFSRASENNIADIAKEISNYVLNQKSRAFSNSKVAAIALSGIFTLLLSIYTLIMVSSLLTSVLLFSISVIFTAWLWGLAHMGVAPYSEWGRLSPTRYKERRRIYIFLIIISFGLYILWVIVNPGPLTPITITMIVHLIICIGCSSLGFGEAYWYVNQPNNSTRKKLFTWIALPLLYSGIWFSHMRTALIGFYVFYSILKTTTI